MYAYAFKYNYAINFCSFQQHCTHFDLAPKNMVNHSELRPYNFSIESSQELDSLMSGTNFELYMLEEAAFLCITLVLFFLRGQTLDLSPTPLSLKAKARIKNMLTI